MEVVTEGDRPTAPQHPLLAMIAQCGDGARSLDALQALQSAADEGDCGAVEPDKAEAHPATSSAATRRTDEPRVAISAAPFSGYSATSFTEVESGAVTRRLSTPERIQQRTSRLYSEVHELMDRHERRNERQRDMARRDSGAYRRQASLHALDARRRSGSIGGGRTGTGSHPKRSSAATREETQQLPDLYKEFEESRQRHLIAAQAERSPFPPRDPLSDPPAASDPDSFSLRFKSVSLSNARRHRQ